MNNFLLSHLFSSSYSNILYPSTPTPIHPTNTPPIPSTPTPIYPTITPPRPSNTLTLLPHHLSLTISIVFSQPSSPLLSFPISAPLPHSLRNTSGEPRAMDCPNKRPIKINEETRRCQPYGDGVGRVGSYCWGPSYTKLLMRIVADYSEFLLHTFLIDSCSVYVRIHGTVIYRNLGRRTFQCVHETLAGERFSAFMKPLQENVSVRS